MGIICLLAAVRWRSLILLMYLFVAAEYAVRIIVGHLKPVVTLGTAPGTIGNYILVPAAIILFLLSNTKKSRSLKS